MCVNSLPLHVLGRDHELHLVVDQLANAQRLIVSSEPDADGWVAIHTAECSGYAKLEYLKAE